MSEPTPSITVINYRKLNNIYDANWKQSHLVLKLVLAYIEEPFQRIWTQGQGMLRGAKKMEKKEKLKPKKVASQSGHRLLIDRLLVYRPVLDLYGCAR